MYQRLTRDIYAQHNGRMLKLRAGTVVHPTSGVDQDNMILLAVNNGLSSPNRSYAPGDYAADDTEYARSCELL